jgi:hypothetical protein
MTLLTIVSPAPVPPSFTHSFRTYRGMRLPPQLVTALQRARELRRAAARLAPHSEERRQATAHATAVQQAARRLARRYHRTVMAEQQQALERLRAPDPHFMYQRLRHGVGGDAHTSRGDGADIPDEDGHPPAAERFQSFFTSLFRETRPPPPGPSSPSWMAHVPTAPAGTGAHLSAPIAWEEVYMSLFPATRRFTPPTCPGQCVLCAQYRSQWQAWRDGHEDTPAPTWKPSLHTSRAAGPDGLPAELLRWTRPEDGRGLFPFRRAVCVLLARFLSRILHDGVPPASFTVNVTALLLKAARPGFEADFAPADPRNSRPITQSNVLAKLLELVITSRLTHWATSHRLISPQQVGFQQLRGAEWHVFTLRESLRARQRAGQRTYALFIDISKAYDRVSQPALWAVLRHMGVPEPLLRLLRVWGQMRTTSITVNGTPGTPFEMTSGVPQGSVLSPLLFNLYIESLSRYISSLPRYRGVDVLGMTLRHLLYADDIVLLADSESQLRMGLEAVAEWMGAWGLQLGVGSGKSEAMAFGAPLPTSPLEGGGYSIPWTDQYRYLGYLLRSDLTESHIPARLVTAMHAAAASFFYANATVRGLSPALQLQLLKSNVAGAVNYLRSVVYLDEDECASLDAVTTAIARRATGVYNRAPPREVWTRSQLLPFSSICARERVRLFLQLRYTPVPEDIAPRLLRRLMAERRTRASVRPDGNWAHWLGHTLRVESRYGPVRDHPRGYYDIPRVAGVYGRSLAFGRAQHAARRTPGLQLSPRPVMMDVRPAPISTAQHIADLHGHYHATPASLGTAHYSTPLSAQGPGTTGSLLALTTLRPEQLWFTMRMRFGRRALFTAPFLPLVGASGTTVESRMRAANRASACPLCGEGLYCLWHLLFECRYHTVCAARVTIRRTAAETLRRIVCHLLPHPTADPPEHDDRDLKAAIRSHDWDSEEGRRIIYQLFMAAPWQAAMAPRHWRLARAIGALFDQDRQQVARVRPAVNIWLHWANRSSRLLQAASVPRLE